MLSATEIHASKDAITDTNDKKNQLTEFSNTDYCKEYFQEKFILNLNSFKNLEKEYTLYQECFEYWLTLYKNLYTLEIDFSKLKLNERELIFITKLFPHVKNLTLSNVKLDSEALSLLLLDFNALENLVILKPMRTSTLHVIKQLPHLTALKISKAGITKLDFLPQSLEELDLSGCAIAPQILETISNNQLKSLFLKNGTHVEPGKIKEILPQLNKLKIGKDVFYY
jgi:hypothetical protein